MVFWQGSITHYIGGSGTPLCSKPETFALQRCWYASAAGSKGSSDNADGPERRPHQGSSIEAYQSSCSSSQFPHMAAKNMEVIVVLLGLAACHMGSRLVACHVLLAEASTF